MKASGNDEPVTLMTGVCPRTCLIPGLPQADHALAGTGDQRGAEAADLFRAEYGHRFGVPAEAKAFRNGADRACTAGECGHAPTVLGPPEVTRSGDVLASVSGIGSFRQRSEGGAGAAMGPNGCLPATSTLRQQG